jgi:hypothetical protein
MSAVVFWIWREEDDGDVEMVFLDGFGEGGWMDKPQPGDGYAVTATSPN